MAKTSPEIEAFKTSLADRFAHFPDLALSPPQPSIDDILASLKSVRLSLPGDHPSATNQTHWNDILNASYYTAENLQGPAALGGYAALVPLAAILLKEDIKEIREAALQNKLIAENEDRIQQSIRKLDNLLQQFPDDTHQQLVAAELRRFQEKLEWLNAEKKRNHSDALTGALSAGSNTTTLLSSVGQIGTNAALLAQTKNLAAGQIIPAALNAAANGINLAGTLALNPISALCMGGVAASAFARSAKEAKEFREAKEKIAARLESVQEAAVDPEQAEAWQHYQEFLARKLDQRDRFAQKSKQSDAGFLSATMVNAAIVITKTVIGALALAGIAAVSASPAGPALLGLGVGALVAVGVGYQVYYYHQRKKQRYHSYRPSNDPNLDKDLLRRVEQEHSQGITTAFHLRAGYHHLITSEERRRQALLERASTDERKFYSPRRYSTNPGPAEDTWRRLSNYRKNLSAQFSLRSFRRRHLKNWLTRPESFELQANFMEANLRDQLKLLRRSMSLRRELQEPEAAGHDTLPDSCQQLINRITEFKTRVAADSPEPELSSIVKDYLQLNNQPRSFAKYLWEGETRFRTRRGELLATEKDLAARPAETRPVVPRTWEPATFEDLHQDLAAVGRSPAAKVAADLRRQRQSAQSRSEFHGSRLIR
jgi:hypothetical protein